MGTGFPRNFEKRRDAGKGSNVYQCQFYSSALFMVQVLTCLIPVGFGMKGLLVIR